MSTPPETGFIGILRVGAVAGIAGGLTEIAWVTFYGALTGMPTEPVARGIVTTLIPALAGSSWSILLGVVIHLSLAFALGLGLAMAVQGFARHGRAAYSEFGLVMVVLGAVWAVNFLVVLPYLNPDFVRLLPYGVTLLSKLLFGLSTAIVFWADGRRRFGVQGA